MANMGAYKCKAENAKGGQENAKGKGNFAENAKGTAKGAEKGAEKGGAPPAKIRRLRHIDSLE